MYLELNYENSISVEEFVLTKEKDSEKNFLLEKKDFKILIIEKDGVLSINKKLSKFPKNFDLENFEYSLNVINEKKMDVENSGFDNDEIEEIENDDGTEPYNPEHIRVETKSFSIHQINEMMTSWNDIDLSPDFQRSFVWSDLKRRSRLIESILLRIPLPVFYFSSDKQGKMQVVDGVQRLTVIKQFFNGEFKLTKLEYLKDLNGVYYPSSDKIKDHKVKVLDPMYVRRILQTQVVVNIIDPASPAKVKYDIFKRINTGGKPLNAQEIRNCMAKVHVRKILKQLSELSSFKKLTSGINTSRMMDHELVMRFIGFYLLKVLENEELSYRGDMDVFLDETLEYLNTNQSNDLANELISKFDTSMKNADYLFGEYAFKKCFLHHLNDKKRKAFLNKALFTSWSISLSKVPYEKIEKKYSKNTLIRDVAKEISNKDEYFKSIQISTNSTKNLNVAFSYAEQILKRGK